MSASCEWAKRPGGESPGAKRPGGETSRGQNVLVAKRPVKGRNVQGAKRPVTNLTLIRVK